MDVFVFGMLCEPGMERAYAYDMLAYGVKKVYGLLELPEICHEEGGKPYFPERRDICFNISHSRGCAVCALHDQPIGIDVEVIRSAPKRLAAGMDDRSFFALWTAKESSVKREGRGIGAMLHGYDPDPLCRTFDKFLPDCIVSVCPSYAANIQLEIV